MATSPCSRTATCCASSAPAGWGWRPPTGQLFALGTAALSALGYEHDYRVINVWNQDSYLVREQCP